MTETTTQRRTQRSIPDLWEIAHLEELKGYTLGGRSARDLIIETWHLAHDLRKSNLELLEACKALLSLDAERCLGEVPRNRWLSITEAAQSAITKATQSTTGAHT